MRSRQCSECGVTFVVSDGPGRKPMTCGKTSCWELRRARNRRRREGGNVSASELAELRSRGRWAVALRVVDGLHKAGYIEVLEGPDRENARDFVAELLGEPVPGATLADMLEEAARRLRGET